MSLWLLRKRLKRSTTININRLNKIAMLNKLDIHINELDTTYFDYYYKIYCVDGWWTEEEDNDNTDYRLDEPCERGATIAKISEDGESIVWVDNFDEAISKNEDNAWVLEEIEEAQRRIKEEYYSKPKK